MNLYLLSPRVFCSTSHLVALHEAQHPKRKQAGRFWGDATQALWELGQLVSLEFLYPTSPHPICVCVPAVCFYPVWVHNLITPVETVFLPLFPPNFSKRNLGNMSV